MLLSLLNIAFSDKKNGKEKESVWSSSRHSLDLTYLSPLWMQFMYICFLAEYSNFATFWIYTHLLANSRCDCYKNLVTRHEKIFYYSLPSLLQTASLTVASAFFFLYVCFSASTLSSWPRTRSSCARFNSSSAWLPWTYLRVCSQAKMEAISSKHLFV